MSTTSTTFDGVQRGRDAMSEPTNVLGALRTAREALRAARTRRLRAQAEVDRADQEIEVARERVAVNEKAVAAWIDSVTGGPVGE